MTLSNKITLSRVALGPLFLWSFLSSNIALSLFFLFLNLFGDVIDGQIARRRGQTTKLGEIIDPLVDSMFFVFVVLSFSIDGIEDINWFLVPLVFLGLSFLLPHFKKGNYKMFHTKTKYFHSPFLYALVFFIIIDNDFWKILFLMALIFFTLTSIEVFIRSLRYSIKLSAKK